ncbi:SusC/RagA family TonB-linked outer membrane protein [Flavobacterium orientale]|uniref:SusC/RagA family TonB-linked outer membrane protein n=1 Tax=Flavobacterium orientale TaxID=1756020 RepID=A0A917D9S0_9FLAO|nr:SusC/RagA family TonB-linked outer membrane protein [Flavobacterium orientale]GGD14525.1 SusC/RagA family TonB-linked outer membrane protein [Flavobacterium orientale]
MRSKFKWIYTLLLAFFIQFSYAQEKTITGTVTEGGLPLPGVTVIVKGTQRGTSSDFDGKYSISARQGEVLEFTFIGLKTQTFTVGASNSINVVMQADVDVLEGVVLEGYRTSSKATSVSSIATVTAEGIENRPNPNVLSSLQGQVAGANISAFSGQPGTNKIDVIIRGVGSLSASSDPLYVIDGVPMNQAFFRNLNANEIESVSVLKDAAATAIYGNRGSNGVIVITTKKGSFKKSFSVNYSTSYGLTDFRGDNYGLPTAVQHLQLQRKGFDEGVNTLSSALANSGSFLGGAVTADINNLEGFATNTDWQDLFFRTGTTASHDLSFTVGSDNLNNYTSFGYFEQDGITPTTNFKRFTIRSNFSGKSTNEKFNYGLNIFGAFSRRQQLEQETRGDINSNVLQNPLTGYLASPRFVSPDLYESGQQLFNDFGNPALNLTPLMLLDLFQHNSAPSFFNEIKTIITATGSYKITNDLTFSSTGGVDFADDKRNFAIGPNAYLSIVRASGAAQPFHGLETISSTSEFSFNYVNRLNYKKTFAEKHTIDASVYSEYMKAHRRVSLQQQIGLNPLTWEPGAGTGYIIYNPATQPVGYRPTVAAAKIDAGMLSVFSSIDYDYDRRFGFAATVRRDGTYRFVDDYKWGTFWSVAGRWNISNEAFLSDSSWLSELKLRASYGTTGNQNVIARGVDSNTSPFFIGSQLVRDLNSSQVGYNNSASFGVSSYANRDLRWEETAQWNIGLDFGIQRRLTGQFDVYNRRTNDLYGATPISAGNGITNLSANNGTLENRGVELALKYDVFKDSEFKLSFFGNGAYNRSAFRDLGVLDSDGDGIFRVGTDFQYRVGGPLNEYFQVPYAGVNPATGNLLFYDIDGNLTETPTDGDRRSTGKNALPDFQGGFGFNASYKGFFLDALFTYAIGAYKFDIDYDGLMDIRNSTNFPVSTDLFNAWTPTNTDTNVPALNANNYDTGSVLSDRFLRDASYMRLRNLTVGYSVPAKFLERSSINTIRLRVQAENYFTFTNWKGFDPESYVTSQTGYYPTPKIITFGLDVNF